MGRRRATGQASERAADLAAVSDARLDARIRGRARALAGAGGATGWLLAALAFAGALSALADRAPALGAWSVAPALAAALLARVAHRALWLGPHRRRAALEVLAAEVARHRPALRRNLGRALRVNDYGRVVADTREAAVGEFLDSIGFPPGLLAPAAALEAVEAMAGVAHAPPGEATDPFDAVPADPILFEAWVAERLSERGWDARPTPAQGDQGIDVIARKGGVGVGLQCKLYTGAVGNRAVQEVIAGLRFHGLARGAVVTNATYTRSAVDLARSAGVVLMSHHDLADPDRLLLGEG